MSGFDQQRTHHGIALLADPAQPLLAAGRVLARIQSQIAHHLLAALEAFDRTQRQHERQRRNRPYSGMRAQQNRCLILLGLFLYGAIQLLQGAVELIDHLEQLLPAIAGPRSQIQSLQLGAALFRPQLLFAAHPLAHRQRVPGSAPRRRSTARVPTRPAGARTSACVPWPRCPPALAPATLHRRPGLLRWRAPDDARLPRRSRCPASQSAGSACVNHNLQSACARLHSSEPWCFERYQVYPAAGSRHGYLISPNWSARWATGLRRFLQIWRVQALSQG